MIKTNFKESVEWTSDEGHNVAFLRLAERQLNDMIQVRGYIYENEMYQVLGIPWDPAKDNRLYLPRNDKYVLYPGRFVAEYFPGSEILLIHDSAEEQS